MKHIVKRITAIAMAFTLIGTGTTIAKTVSPNASYTFSANAAFQPYNGRVTADFLWVRKGPNGKKLYLIDYDTPVAILEVKGEWGRVSHVKENQWVSLKYIEKISEATAKKLGELYNKRQTFNPPLMEKVATPGGLILRDRPSKKGSICGIYTNGTIFYVYKTRYDLDNRIWGAINAEGTRWVCLVENDCEYTGIIG